MYVDKRIKYNVRCMNCKVYIPVADSNYRGQNRYVCKNVKDCNHTIRSNRQIKQMNSK